MAGSAAIELRPVPPFRLDLTVWALRRRPENVIDRWDGRTYRRTLAQQGKPPFEIEVTQSALDDAPRLSIAIGGAEASAENTALAKQAVERLLGTSLDLGPFYCLADHDGRLGALAGQFRGFKPPRFATYFETLVNAVSCQQLSLTMGIRLLCRLADRYGQSVATDRGIFHAFPRPDDVAAADPEEMRLMGFSYQKARAIIALAQAIIGGQLNLRQLEALDDAAALELLCSLRGVGRWTAEYFLLRGLGRIHVFPADDVGARNNLQRWLHLRAPLRYEKVHRALKPWRGFGGLVYFHLLLKSLQEKGLLIQ